MHRALFEKKYVWLGHLKAETTSLRSVSHVPFVAQVLLEFGWQLESVSERLQQKIPNLLRGLEKEEKKA